MDADLHCIAAFRTATNNKNGQRLSFPFKASHHAQNDYENDKKYREKKISLQYLLYFEFLFRFLFIICFCEDSKTC